MMEECLSQNCSICLEPLTDCPDAESEIHKNDCEHVFHGHCLSEWFRIGVPGNCCPLCRKSVEGMEAAEMSPSEDDDEIPISSSVPESGEPLPGVEPQDQEEITEEFRQTLVQLFSELGDAFTECGNQVTVASTRLRTAEEFISGFVPSTTTEQEELDVMREALSEAQEAADNIQEFLEEALEITANASESRDRSTVMDFVNDLKAIYQSVREQTLTLHETFERLPDSEIMNNTV